MHFYEICEKYGENGDKISPSYIVSQFSIAFHSLLKKKMNDYIM